MLGAAHASMSAIERWIAEEAILDTLTSFEGNRWAGVEVEVVDPVGCVPERVREYSKGWSSEESRP